MNNGHRILLICGILGLMMWAQCSPKPDFEALRLEILDLHQQFIQAHLEKNVDFMVQDLGDNFIFVSHGEIRHQKREEIREQFDNYLNSTTFSSYRDLEEPIVGFSADASMAWAITRINVAGKRNLADGKVREFDVNYAWITVYRRQGKRWVRLTEVSTNN